MVNSQNRDAITAQRALIDVLTCRMMGGTFQFVICPILVAFAFVDSGVGLNAWLVKDQASVGIADRVAARALLCYFGKDLLEQQSLLYHLHHIACVSMTFGALFVPCAGTSVIGGACVLEFGTACMCLSRLRPKCEGSRWLYVLGMSASNVLAAGLVLFMLQLDCLDWSLKSVYAVVIGILLFMRQRHLMHDFSQSAGKAK